MDIVYVSYIEIIMKETDRNEGMSVKQEMARPDMGSGSVRKLLAKLAVPAVVAQIVNTYHPAGAHGSEHKGKAYAEQMETIAKKEQDALVTG